MQQGPFRVNPQAHRPAAPATQPSRILYPNVGAGVEQERNEEPEPFDLDDSPEDKNYRDMLLDTVERASHTRTGAFERHPAPPSREELARRFQYYFKIRKPPFAYQEQGVHWLASARTRMLNDDMGIGKSMQVLASAPSRYGLLIVCPASVIGTWKQEVKIWRPDLIFTSIVGSSNARPPRYGEAVAVSWKSQPTPQALRFWTDRRNKPVPFHLIGDEIQYAKTPSAATHKRFYALAKRATSLVGVTGTPLENAPPDLWGVFRALNMDSLLGTFKRFEKFFIYDGKGKTKKAVGAHDQLREILKLATLRRKEREVFPQLPPMLHQVWGVPITENRAFFDHLLFLLGGEQALRNKLDRANDCGVGAIDKNLTRAREQLALAKLPVFIRDAVSRFEAAGEPMMVFCPFKAPCELLAKRRGWAVITSEVSRGKRDRIREDFNSGVLKYVAVTKAASVGVSFTGPPSRPCTHVYRLSLDWVPGTNRQMEKRVRRSAKSMGMDMRRRYRVIDVVGQHPIEWIVYQAVRRKENLMADLGLDM